MNNSLLPKYTLHIQFAAKYVYQTVGFPRSVPVPSRPFAAGRTPPRPREALSNELRVGGSERILTNLTQPEEGLEAVALHEDPGEEPFCSPTDAPVATERYRRHKGPHGNANRRQREGITTGREKGMGRARRLLPLRFYPKKPADATAFFANRHGPNRRPYAHNRKARTERTLQPRTGSSLRTEHGPTDPVLGANPSSEGTDPFCRLPLPTLMPSTRGCTPWRPAADGGYGPARELRNNRTRIFQGRRKRTGFPKKGDLGLAKNYRGITLTSIAAKIYNALLRNRIEPKMENILRKNQNGFRRNRSTTSQILTIRRILEGVRAKNLQATLLFVDFTKAFDSIHRGKMEQILLAYGLPKETVAAIMILYRNTKVKVRSPDGDTEYFDIVAGVLQGDTLAPYLFIICLDYVLRTSIDKIRENGFELTKRRSKRYPAKTITDADYADDLALLANTPNQAETLLHSLERAAAGIGLHVNANKTEYMCYNQTGNIATLDGASLKLVDKFTYLGSSVSSTEKDIDTRLTKAWTAIDRLSIIWKSDLTDKMKRSFFQAAVVSILLYGCTTWTLTKRLERRLDGNYTRMLRAVLNKSWRQHPTRLQLYGHLPPITKTIQVRRTRHAGHCWRSKDELISDVLLWTPTHGCARVGRPARTYIQQLCEDTGCNPEDLPEAMNDREKWRETVRDIRAGGATWWWWWCISGGVCCVMVTVERKWALFRDETVCISHSAYTLGKELDLTSLPLANGK